MGELGLWPNLQLNAKEYSMKSVNGLMQNYFLHERLSQFDRLTQIISNFMSLPLENRLWPLVRGRRLILLTDDPQFATQARFMHKPLCQHIREHTELNVSRLEVKLMSVPLQKRRRQLNRQAISPEAAGIISSIAGSIDDQELQTALQKLAENN